jgi:hypothetical protein
MRVFATGQGRKTDATDAHSVALAATRMQGLRPVVDSQQLAVLRILADRRRSLGQDHTRMISQLHPRRPHSGNGPGRTRGGGYWLQRGRLAPQRRRFGEVTSRARHQRPYARPSKPADPFSAPLPPPGQRRPAAARPGTHSQGGQRRPLDTEGSQKRSIRSVVSDRGGSSSGLAGSAKEHWLADGSRGLPACVAWRERETASGGRGG